MTKKKKLVLVIFVYLQMFSVSQGKIHEEDFKQKVQGIQKEYDEYVKLGPEQYIKKLKKTFQAIPGLESLTKDENLATYFYITQMMFKVHLDDPRLDAEDTKKLKEIYENTDNPKYFRSDALALLYLATDDIEYLKKAIFILPEGMSKYFTSYRDDNYEKILLWAIGGQIKEVARIEKEGYSLAQYPFISFIDSDIARTCRSIKRNGLSEVYSNIIFQHMGYSNPLYIRSPERIVQDIHQLSKSMSNQYVSALMYNGKTANVIAIKKISEEYEKIINDIAQKRKEAYSIYSDAPGISSAQSVEPDSQESK